MSDKLLTNCAGDKLLTNCAGDKLLQSCTPPAPKDICTEFNNAPDPYSFYLKFTWSGTLTRCTDCWDLNSYNHWLCTAAPTSLPNFALANSCLSASGALPSAYTLVVYIDFCGGTDTGSYSDSWAFCLWKCTDGLFELLVVSSSNFFPLFYASGYNVKDGDVLANQLGCLSFVHDPCTGSNLTFPAFVTGGSYKVEIVP